MGDWSNWPAEDRKYKTYLISEALHDRLRALATAHRIAVPDLLDYALRAGLEQIDAGQIPLVAIEDVSKLRVIDRTPRTKRA
jgi:hypothetical protein